MEVPNVMNSTYNIIQKKINNKEILINPHNFKYKPQKKESAPPKRKSFYLRQMIPFPPNLKSNLIDTLVFSDTPGNLIRHQPYHPSEHHISQYELLQTESVERIHSHDQGFVSDFR